MSDALDPIDRHLTRVLETVKPLPVERLPLGAAHGLVLAEDVVSTLDAPVFDNSGMDGYAVRHADTAAAGEETPVTLRVVADIPAGSPLDPPLAPGEAARIMTGAAVPSDADAIVPLEHTDRGTGTVTITVAPAAGAHIRRRGEDLTVGTTALRAGDLLTPYRVAAAAAAGAAEVPVRRAPFVAVISTGSELRAPGQPLERGQIPESNSLLLAGLARQAGGHVVRVHSVPDDVEALRAELDTVVAIGVDLVVLSGGVSVGAYDVVKATLAPLGTVGFHRVAMQPGKPQGFGTIGDGVPVFGLPGNPVSAAVSFEVFVRPALLRLQGAAQLHRPRLHATVADGWNSTPGRTQYMPIVFERGGDAAADTAADATAGADAERAERRVRRATQGGSGSHLVGGLARAEGYAIVPAETTRVNDGDVVTVIEI